MNRYYDGKYRPNYPKPESEKAHLRKNIISIQPDILALQELGSLAHLKELQHDLKNEGYTMEFLAFSNDPGRDRNLAFLSRIPILKSTAHEGIKIHNGYGRQSVLRGLLEIEIRHNHEVFKIFNLHLKSRRTSHPSDPNGSQYRHQESRAILEVIYSRTKNGRMNSIVLGDFNDYANSPTLSLFKNNKKVRLHPVNAIDKKGESWTHYYRKGDIHSTLDYILVSSLDFIHKQSGHIHYDRYYYKASDHRPVYIDLIDN